MTTFNFERLWAKQSSPALKVEPMDRLQRIFEHLDIEKNGLEIGPSYSPLASKKSKYKVHIIDHLSTQDLIEKYRSDPLVNENNIEEVDFVWQGESLADTVQGNKYDWVIASHVIEHVLNPIGFLIDLSMILNVDGVISLAIPDYRFCFDSLRGASSIAEIISAHEERLTKHRPASVFEHYFTSCEKNGVISWSEGVTGDVSLRYSFDVAKKMFDEASQPGGEYIDIHAWKFSPHVFQLMFKLAKDLYQIDLEIVSVYQTLQNEFHVSIKKTDIRFNDSEKNNLNLLKNILKEGRL
jgi:hypothetical protein